MARKGSVRTATATTSAALLVPARTNRTGLVLFPSPDAGETYTISDSPNVTSGKGIFVSASLPAVVLDAAIVGDLVQKALYVIGSTAAVDFGFVEVIE